MCHTGDCGVAEQCSENKSILHKSHSRVLVLSLCGRDSERLISLGFHSHQKHGQHLLLGILCSSQRLLGSQTGGGCGMLIGGLTHWLMEGGWIDGR